MVPEPEMIVADASVVLKWQLDDEDCIPQAMALRDDFYTRGAVKVIAPHLLIYEVINGIVTAARQKRIAPDKVIEALSNLMALGVEMKELDPLRTLEVSLKYNITAYDAAYLSLAEAEDCDLLTGDKTFYQVVKDELPRVKWIGEYKEHMVDR